eukprot:3623740-Prorocentrum_lima.AAC.1
MAFVEPALPWPTLRALHLLVADLVPSMEVGLFGEDHPQLARTWPYGEEIPMQTRLWACGDLEDVST